MNGIGTPWRLLDPYARTHGDLCDVIIRSTRTRFALLLALLACQPAMATDIVVIGRLVTNEPMDYVKGECPEDNVCLHSWWKSVVQVQKTVRGISLSGRVAAASMQHTSLNSRFKKAVRLFVLEPIGDPELRAKLRAEYYLKEMSEPHQMFCSSRDPAEWGLNLEETYVAGTGDSRSYCFELPTG